MKNNATLLYSFALVIGDFVALVAAFAFAYVLRYKFEVGVSSGPLVTPESGRTYLSVLISTIPLWLLVFALLGLYNKNVFEKRFSELGRLFIGTAIGVLVAIAWQFFTQKTIFPARLLPIYVVLIGYGFLVLFRSLIRWTQRMLFSYGYGINNVLIVGDTPTSQEMIDMLRNTRMTGYRVAGIIGSHKHPVNHIHQSRIFTNFETAIETLKHEQLHSIIQTELYADAARNDAVLSYAQENHVAYRFVPGNSELFVGNIDVDLFRSVPVIAVHQTAIVGWGRIAKRIFDFFVSLTAIILLSPVMLLIYLILLLSGGKPIYQRLRLTRFGTSFPIYKFRSLKVAYSGIDPEQGFEKMGKPELIKPFRENGNFMENDPRLSKVGKFLRGTSLDELPQLFNVLKGDISLIGPRALIAEELETYSKKSLILTVKSGITGLAQISGRNELPVEERRKLDLYYVQNWSFWFDLVILAKTLRLWLFGGRAK